MLKHPVWAVTEGSARLRKCFAPKHGARSGKLGTVNFEFDFELSPFMRQMYVHGYETDIVRLMRKLLRPGNTFVDVGANVGYLSAIAASCVGEQGTVISYEPAPPYFSRLAALRENNPAYNWYVYNIGLGAEATTTELTMSGHNIGWNSIVPNQIPQDRASAHVTIPLRRLDECLKEAGLAQVDVLKIDVEGYEANVLLGAESTLKAGLIKNIIVELLPRQYPLLGLDFGMVMQMVARFGYEARVPRWPYSPINWADVIDGDNVWFARINPGGSI